MKKKEFLVLLVQTWVLAHGTKRSSDPLHKAQYAVGTLDYLRRLLDVMSDDQLPDELAGAAEHFCKWQDQTGEESRTNKIPRPEWLPPNDPPRNGD